MCSKCSKKVATFVFVSIHFSMALTDHRKHNVISCVCGKLITGKHKYNISISKIEVVVCDYSSQFSKTEKVCPTCIVKEKEQRYEQQWDKDESGYCICAECGEKTDYGLPKRCSCKAFIDIDGEAKCKSCLKVWTEPYLDSGECSKCGYQGD